MAYATDKEPTGLTAKVTPVDADVIVIGDSADASEVAKKITWSNIKATLKTYFDTLYQASGSYLTSANIVATITNGVTTNAPSEDAVFDALALKANLASPTFTGTVVLPDVTAGGNITLGENTSIDLDPAGSVDGKYSGICITGTAGAALSFGQLIYLAVADSRWELADADATATAGTPLLGMCVLAAGADGNATKILLQGTIRADAQFPALTVGAPAYVGETAGAIQTAIPTGADNVIRVVGRALTADELYFCPSQDHQISVA